MKDDARIPEWKLERYLIGELPTSDMELIRGAVESDPSVRRQLEQLLLSNQALLAQYPPDRMTRKIRERAAATAAGQTEIDLRTGRFGSLPKLAAIALAVTIVCLIFLPRQIDRTLKDGTSLETRFKGGVSSLVLYRKIPSGAERLNEGDIARSGDTIQIAYWGVGGTFGVILSLDGRGGVTLHFPENGSRAALLEGGHLTRLDSAYELDDAPEWESFYFITSNQPFEIEPVLQSARSVGRAETAPQKLPLSASFTQSSFRLRKAINK
jgi:hypothetical protein